MVLDELGRYLIRYLFRWLHICISTQSEAKVVTEIIHFPTLNFNPSIIYVRKANEKYLHESHGF
jgi:hypothetical protein